MKTYSTEFGTSLIAFVVIGALILAIHSAMASVLSAPKGDMSAAAIAKRIAPVGQLNTGAPMKAAAAPAPAASSAKAARSGAQIFNSVCMACHATGAAGAPKVGDKAAWAPRIAKGISTLWQHAIHGFSSNGKTMPPRGTCGDCSDKELKNAIEYMISKSK